MGASFENFDCLEYIVGGFNSLELLYCVSGSSTASGVATALRLRVNNSIGVFSYAARSSLCRVNSFFSEKICRNPC